MPKLEYRGTTNSMELGLTGKEIDYLSGTNTEEATRMLREVGFALYSETSSLDSLELYRASFKTEPVKTTEGVIETPGADIRYGYEDARELRKLLSRAAHIQELYPGLAEGVEE